MIVFASVNCPAWVFARNSSTGHSIIRMSSFSEASPPPLAVRCERVTTAANRKIRSLVPPGYTKKLAIGSTELT